MRSIFKLLLPVYSIAIVEKRSYGGSHWWKPCVGKPLVKARLQY
ncbi:hypothetical protein V6Z12_A07G222900 [Gossypium hirsutum]